MINPPNDLFLIIERLIQKAPADWINSVCEMLRSLPVNTSVDYVLKSVPTTNNADLFFLFADTVRKASIQMSWEALSWVIAANISNYHRRLSEQKLDFLWSGPSPTMKIPARRIDQVLYDLIAKANQEILLVTFAAAKIQRLIGELTKAKQRGVHIRLILEFEQSSEGQLSYDALKAFPPSFIATTEVFYWPVEKRERNQAGRPGKLHAKLAVIDDKALISSANLTDDAFNRNLEVGVMIKNTDFLMTIKAYIDSLVFEKILYRL